MSPFLLLSSLFGLANSFNTDPSPRRFRASPAYVPRPFASLPRLAGWLPPRPGQATDEIHRDRQRERAKGHATRARKLALWSARCQAINEEKIAAFRAALGLA